MSRTVHYIGAAVLASMLACGAHAAENGLLKRQDSNTLVVLATISWHGDHIRPPNLTALQDLRRSYPGTHMLHLVDAAYWTKKNANKADTTAKIRSLITTGDEIGMLLQGWRSLTQAAGVKFRVAPTLWGEDVDLKDCENDCGREVPLTEYNAEEVDKIVKFALQQFADAGLTRPRTVQLAGWLSSAPIQEVLARNQFQTDLSAVPPATLQPLLKRYPLYTWLKTRWQNITPTSAAQTIDTGAGKIVQGVVNTASMEFVTPQQVVQLAKTFQDGGLLRSNVLHLNINQETAAEHYPRWRATLQALQAYAAANNLKLQFLSLPLAY